MDFDPVNSRLTSIETKLGGVEARLGTLENHAKSLESTAKAFVWIVGVGGVAILGLIFAMAESKIREIARTVVREELAIKATTRPTRESCLSAR